MDVDVDPPASAPQPNTTSRRASAKPRKASTRNKSSPSVPPPTPWPSPFVHRKNASAPARTASVGPASDSPTPRQPEGDTGDGGTAGSTSPSAEVSAPPVTLPDAAAPPPSPQPDLHRITIGNKRRLQELRVLLATQQGYLEACEELAQWCDDGRAYTVALSAELDKTLKALAEQSIAPGYDLRPAMTVLEVVSRWRDSMSVMAHVAERLISEPLDPVLIPASSLANLQRYVEFIIMHMEHRRTHEIYRSKQQQQPQSGNSPQQPQLPEYTIIPMLPGIETQQLCAQNCAPHSLIQAGARTQNLSPVTASHMLASAASRLFPVTSHFISPSSSHLLPSLTPHPVSSSAHFSTAAATAWTSSDTSYPDFKPPHSPLLSEGTPSSPAFGYASMEGNGPGSPERFHYAGVGDDTMAGDCGVDADMEVAEACVIRVTTGGDDDHVKYYPDSESGDPSPRAATTPGEPSPTLTPRAPTTPVIAGIDPLAAASMAAAATVAEAVCAESLYESYLPVSYFVWPGAPMDPYASATQNDHPAACFSSNSCSPSSAPSPHPSSVPSFSRFPSRTASRPGSPNPHHLHPPNNPLSGTNDPHLPVLASELQDPDLFGGWDWSGSSVVASTSIEGALGPGTPRSMQASAGGDMGYGYHQESALNIFDVNGEFPGLGDEI
ncbi:hypothetical protein BDK51DRAFT_43143 [Blyttiomyces helicus]|uniref:ZMIZ1 N-terminal domain-containing protein n=1 Tax=Blyttiomyces helicus TaxID=388810 RepID=A0A4P9WMG2_9FUNG|nr:hypothetical protein BDK51DRAFT_43143 [Blyttiomyces helicus]|eukprot:RKO93405.1 hypothetical protein BDK51DRAFT_43143 [Blyttiomyces helicus]